MNMMRIQTSTRAGAFALLLGAAAVLTACWAAPYALAAPTSAEERERAKSPTTIENHQHGFRVDVPPELVVVEKPGSKQTIVQLASKSASKAGTNFRESVQIRLESSRPLPGVSLEQAAKGLRGSMEKHGIKVLETKDAKLGGVDAKRIVYTHRLDTAQVKADVKAVIYIAMRNDWTYGVDVRATDKTYDEFLPVAQKVIDSFKWTPKAGGGDEDKGKGAAK
jgi:hypothetical protein